MLIDTLLPSIIHLIYYHRNVSYVKTSLLLYFVTQLPMSDPSLQYQYIEDIPLSEQKLLLCLKVVHGLM